MKSRKHIIVIDDDPDMVRIAKDLLEGEGYSVDMAADAESGLQKIHQSPPDLVLLDVRLPGDDGLTLCRTLKATPAFRHIPVLMISVKSQEADVVTGLELGAEDYIRKPFLQGEMIARVRTALRRRRDLPAAEENVNAGPFDVNFGRHEIKVDGKLLPLSPKEFRLLAFFVRNNGRVLTRQTISDQVWETAYLPTSRTIDFHVDSLRKKLGSWSACIHSLKGVGYRFEVPETA